MHPTDSVEPRGEAAANPVWDTGYVPCALVALGYLAPWLPFPFGLLALLAAAWAPIVALCIALGDRAEGQRVSRATRWSWWAVLGLPGWLYLVSLG